MSLVLREPVHQQVIAVAVMDFLEDGLSAVYTFYEPSLRAQGLGTLCILQQIALTREQGLPYLYLGYWVPGCQKMSYKTNFKPNQRLIAGQWVD